MPAKSKAQQRLFGMVHAYQKGKLKHAPASVKRIAKHISEEDAEHFAKTRHEGLPETKKAEVIQMTRYEQGFMNKCAEYGLDADTSVKLMQKSAATPRGVRSMVGIFANGSPEKVKQAVRWLKRLGFAGSTSDLAKIHGAVKANKPVGAASLARALEPAVDHEVEGHGGSLIRSLVNNGPKATRETFPGMERLIRGIDDSTLQRAVENGLKATGRKNPKGYVDELVLKQIADRVNGGQQLAKLLKGKKVKISPSRLTSADTAKTFLDTVQNGRKGPMFDGYYPGRYELV